MTVRVAVIVVNWNGGAHLEACLRALAAQSEPGFQALVVDNGSQDGSQALVHALGDPRFSLLQLDTNTGFAHANNVGVRECGACDLIALLNPDAVPETEWLAELLRAAAAFPSMGAFGSHLIAASNRTVSDGTGDAYHFSGRAYRRDHGVPVASSAREAAEIFSACAAAALYRRRAWDAAGGFDEDFFCYLEDVDLGFRLRLLGWGAMHVPTSVCYHAASALTGRHSDFSTYYGQRNMVWTFVKNMPSWLFWLLSPMHLLLNLAAPVAFTRRGQAGLVLRAKRDALRQWPSLWRKRRAVQSRRVVGAVAIWKALDKGLWPGRATVEGESWRRVDGE
jgi:GT2 family glycosyltransferase